MSFRPESRWNIWDWYDFMAVLRLQIPPYRWQRCVPLGRFGFGFGRPYGMLVWRFGWWGFRLSSRRKLIVKTVRDFDSWGAG